MGVFLTELIKYRINIIFLITSNQRFLPRGNVLSSFKKMVNNSIQTLNDALSSNVDSKRISSPIQIHLSYDESCRAKYTLIFAQKFVSNGPCCTSFDVLFFNFFDCRQVSVEIYVYVFDVCHLSVLGEDI